MKIKPTVPRTTPISVKVQDVKVRYDPTEHVDGLHVPDDIGKALLKTGHWSEVGLPKVLQVAKEQYRRKAPEVSTFVDKAPEEPADDSLQP